MLLSNDYFNPASYRTNILLDELRDSLAHNQLKGVEISVQFETDQGVKTLQYDVVHLNTGDFIKLLLSYQTAMNNALAQGAQALRSLSVDVVYEKDGEEMSMTIAPEPNVHDFRDLQPIQELDAET